jgi:hypothetical protein
MMLKWIPFIQLPATIRLRCVVSTSAVSRTINWLSWRLSQFIVSSLRFGMRCFNQK